MDLPLVSQSVARVQAWLVSVDTEPKRKALADAAGVHEKTLRLAREPDWNPTRKTLEKLEKLIPCTGRKPAKAKRASAA